MRSWCDSPPWANYGGSPLDPCGRAWTYFRLHLSRAQSLIALRTDHQGIEVLAACLVPMKQGTAAFIYHMNVAPVHDRHKNWVQIEPFLREDVFIAFGAFQIRAPAQYACCHQLLQSARKQVTCDTELGLELIKPPDPKKAFAKDQECPSVSDDRYCSGQGACFFVERVPLHIALISG